MTIDTTELRLAATACDVKLCADETEWDRRFQEFLSECDPDMTLVLLDELDQARVEIAALKAQVAALTPRSYPRVAGNCLACGGEHQGGGSLPCPNTVPACQALARENQRIVPLEPYRVPHPLQGLAE